MREKRGVDLVKLRYSRMSKKKEEGGRNSLTHKGEGDDRKKLPARIPQPLEQAEEF